MELVVITREADTTSCNLFYYAGALLYRLPDGF
jgi:hypothetical protein